MITQIPMMAYVASLGRGGRIKTKLATYSVHHVPPELFGGFESMPDSGIQLAFPEKALVDFAYLSPARGRLFAATPELELPPAFRQSVARDWIGRIASNRLRKLATQKLDQMMAATTLPEASTAGPQTFDGELPDTHSAFIKTRMPAHSQDPQGGWATVLILLVLLIPKTGVASVPAPQPVAGQWSPETARKWYSRQPWLIGCNFLPSTAVNDIEMWQAETFDPATIDRELGWAQQLGFNTVRGFLSYVVWKADPAGLKQRFAQFIRLTTHR